MACILPSHRPVKFVAGKIPVEFMCVRAAWTTCMSVAPGSATVRVSSTFAGINRIQPVALNRRYWTTSDYSAGHIDDEHT
jgi:hypothetical protein